MAENTEKLHHPPGEHCGIFTIPPPIPILGAWRDITYEPVRDTIWTVSEGIYRSIFLEVPWPLAMYVYLAEKAGFGL